MATSMQNYRSAAPFQVLRSILEELRLLRETVGLLLPQEDLDGYANPEKIKRSYQKATKKYPPNYAWK